MEVKGRWDLLYSFAQVVEAGSYTAAAERLQVSKSLLSKRVSQLEHRLGTQLLVRTTRKMRPTEAGQALFSKCSRVFKELDDIENAVSGINSEPIGHLRVACMDILGEQYVSRIATEICHYYPNLQIELIITMNSVDMIAEGFDIAIRCGDMSDSSMRARRVLQLPHVVCAAPAYFARHGVPASVEELADHNCLIATYEPCVLWHFKVGGERITIQPRGHWRSNTGSALVSAALEGVGICRLPELYVRSHLKAGRLLPLFEDLRSDPMPVWMVYPNARYTPAPVRIFMDYFIANIERLTRNNASLIV